MYLGYENPKCFSAGPFFLVFDKNVYRSAEFHPLLWKIYGYAPALRYYSFCKTLYLKHFIVIWIRLCLDNCSVICVVTLCYVLHQTRCMQAYSSIFSIIKAYSCILRHYWIVFRLIKAYLAPCVTLTYSQTYHIPSPNIFRTRGIFKTLWNFDQAYSEPCYRQNSLFRHYSAIFRHIQNLV